VAEHDDQRFEGKYVFMAETGDGWIRAEVDVRMRAATRPANTEGVGPGVGYGGDDGRERDTVALLRDAAKRLERSLQARVYPLPEDEVRIPVQSLPGEAQEVRIRVMPVAED